MPLRNEDCIIGTRIRLDHITSGSWASQEGLTVGSEYSISDAERGHHRRIKISPHGLHNYWVEIEQFELVSHLQLEYTALTSSEGLRVGSRVRCVELTNYAVESNLIIGNIYTVSELNSSQNCIRVNSGHHQNWWIEIHAFALVEPGDMRPLDIGSLVRPHDRVVCLTLGDIPGDNRHNGIDTVNRAVAAGLTVGMVYEVDHINHLNQNLFIIVNGRCTCESQQLERFALVHQDYVEGEAISPTSLKEIPEGTKTMPQVISNYDIGDVEKSIFQAIANKKKKDVYVYDMKGIYYDHPASNTDGIHLYFNCLNAQYYGKASGTVANTALSTSSDYYQGYIRDYQGNRIYTNIPMLDGDTIYGSGITLFVNGDFINSRENVTEDYDRIQYLLCIARQNFGVLTVPIEGSSDTLIDGNIQNSSTVLEKKNRRHIEELMKNVINRERELSGLHKDIQLLSRTFYSDIDSKSDMIANIRRLPNTLSVDVTVIEGILQIKVRTKPLIVHLPHGDIPCGSITISINWKENPVVAITGEYAKYFHPHYNSGPCWGGFESMIIKLLSLNDFDTLIEIIMQWHGAYDGSGVYAPWYKRLQQKEVGIIIEEGFYMSGEGEDE
jgi:hypothetical protein